MMVLTPPGRTPNFLAKLHAILSRNDIYDIIHWLPHGRSWKVFKPRDFEIKVLPAYFDHDKFSSFIRQANGWGFHRLVASTSSSSDATTKSTTTSTTNETQQEDTTSATTLTYVDETSEPSKESTFGSYYHPKFLRGLPHLCIGMKRPTSKNKISCSPGTNNEFLSIIFQ